MANLLMLSCQGCLLILGHAISAFLAYSWIFNMLKLILMFCGRILHSNKDYIFYLVNNWVIQISYHCDWSILLTIKHRSWRSWRRVKCSWSCTPYTRCWCSTSYLVHNTFFTSIKCHAYVLVSFVSAWYRKQVSIFLANLFLLLKLCSNAHHSSFL